MFEQKRNSGPEEPSRYFYIDALRIFAVLLLFPFHTARIFDPWPWYVKSETVSLGLTIFVFFLNQWHMPLFFLLAGASTCLALRFRSPAQYLRERRGRLLVPLFFGILVLIPPQSYYRLFGNPRLVWPGDRLIAFTGGPQYHKSFLGFYPEFFNGIFPDGNFEWGHLWFLAYLFVFSLLALPLFQYLKSESASKFMARLTDFLQKPVGLIFLFIPVAIIEGSLRGLYPSGHQNLISDWANFLTYGTLFVYGFLFFCAPQNVLGIFKYRRLAFAIAIISSLANLGFHLLLRNSLTPYSIAWIFAMILGALSTWFWLVFLMGLGKRFFDRGGRVLEYGKGSAMPVYVLHQTLIVVIGFYVLKSGIPLWPAYAAILAGSFLASLLLYEAIRRNKILRVFFGMKGNA